MGLDIYSVQTQETQEVGLISVAGSRKGHSVGVTLVTSSRLEVYIWVYGKPKLTVGSFFSQTL